MRRIHPLRGSDAFSLLEMLVIMTLIVVLVSLAVPCWGMITRSRSNQAATGIVMDSLEQGRHAAATIKGDVWVVFQHPDGLGPDSLRLLSKQGNVISPLGRWQPLPKGIVFHCGDNLMGERPPNDLLAVSLNSQNPSAKTLFGCVMFQRSGRVGMPLPGGHPLVLELDSANIPISSSISLSRATGRASCR